MSGGDTADDDEGWKSDGNGMEGTAATLSTNGMPQSTAL